MKIEIRNLINLAPDYICDQEEILFYRSNCDKYIYNSNIITIYMYREIIAFDVHFTIYNSDNPP